MGLETQAPPQDAQRSVTKYLAPEGESKPERRETPASFVPFQGKPVRVTGSPSAAACVLGDMDIVRPIGLAGIPCYVVARPGAAPCYSRFTRGVVDWVDAWDQPDRLVERLLEFGRAQEQPPVLFYQQDRDLLLLSRHRELLRSAFRFVVAEPQLVEDLVDKSRFGELAERLNLPVPPSRSLHPAGGGQPEDVDLPFPLILKPLTRRSSQWEPVAGVGKALRIESLDALRQLWPKLVEADLRVLAQQCIDGPETRIESYHVYVDGESSIAGEFTGRKIRTLPRENGHTTACEVVNRADVAALGREIVRTLGLTGVAKLDFKRDHGGRLFLLEINPRFNLWHHPGALAGVNLPALVYADLTGTPRPPVASPPAEIRWSLPWHDLQAARCWEEPLYQWAPWLLRCEARSTFAWDDPMPFLRGVLWRKLARA